MIKMLIIVLLGIALMVLVLMSCVVPVYPAILPTSPALSQNLATTSLPLPDYYLVLGQDLVDPAVQSAQATLDAGQQVINEISYQATLVSLNINLAARAAAQATLDYNQAQLMGLAIRGTEVAQNMAWAAATQQYIVDQTEQASAVTVTAYQAQIEQTQMVWNATSTAQSQAVTATYAAYILIVTQTAQGQMQLDAQDMRYAQANATQQAYSLTATPMAILQSERIQAQAESNRKSVWMDFVVNPLTVFLMTLIILVIILGWVLAYKRFMPVFELGLRKFVQEDNRPVVLLEGRIIEAIPVPAPLISAQPEIYTPKLTSVSLAQIEIVGPDEPSITNWITEAEQKLRFDGWLQS